MIDAPGVIPLQAAQPSFDPSFFIMLGAIFFIFYFLVIRPENRKRKDQEDAIKGAEKGDTIATTGGIQGKVTGVTEDVLTIEIATLKSGERVRVKIMRSGVQSVTKGKGGDAS